MCRSANEPGGPRRCPSHAHAKFTAALAEVLALEARELQLYREASQYASDLMGPSSRAHYWYRQAEREVEQMRDDYGERSDIHLEDYREAYRDLIAAKRASEQTQTEQRQALDALKNRRAEATDALLDVGLCGDEAERMLDGIDRDTALAPPF